MTTKPQISAAREFCEKLEVIPGVSSSHLYDWSDWGEFSAFVYMMGDQTAGGHYWMPVGENCETGGPRRNRRCVVARIAAAIRRVADKEDLVWDLQLECPVMKRSSFRVCCGGSRYTSLEGYERSSIRLDFRILEREEEAA